MHYWSFIHIHHMDLRHRPIESTGQDTVSTAMSNESHPQQPLTGTHYYAPVRPWLRWPARIAGVFMLLSALLMGVANGDWRLSPFLSALMLISVGFQTASVRHDGLRRSTVLCTVLVVLALGGLLYGFLTWRA
jgi:hypothetical protein